MAARLPHLLLASALALSSGAGKTLPRGLAEPPHASDCAGFGPGFVKLTGTDTCVRLGGAARAEFGITSSAGEGRGATRP